MNPKLTYERLNRRAIVYVRQSSAEQVSRNQESQLLQYKLADRARELGFSQVRVIDEDLGRSGSGLIERPGFQRLVGEVCTGEVGAVFCIEASRLARNGRDWHHLIELCGMTGSVVVDPDGVYDPGIVNDRLLLGLKGTMSEFELNLLRQRSREAIRQKANRGELRFCVPVGYIWGVNGIEKDPDLRVQQAIQMIFSKMMELGSVRQVLLWFRRERISLPARVFSKAEDQTIWKLPVYTSMLKILTNPVYAGAYAFGKTQARTRIIGGRVRKTTGHKKPSSEWTVLIWEHHSGYISRDQYEHNQATIAANANMKSRMEPKSGRGGRALLSGMIRCRRCGRMLGVSYTGTGGTIPRYHCKGAQLTYGEQWCISFSGLRTDEGVASELMQVIGGNAVDAALEAASRKAEQKRERRQALVLDIEQVKYEARLAARRYEAVDPDNRLVAAELEARWNATLQRVREKENKLEAFDRETESSIIPSKEVWISLAQDLPAVWNSPSTDMRLKQRIVRILINEIVADVDEESSEIVLVIHWAGGRHSELRVKKNTSGKHRRSTDMRAIEIIRQMAGTFTDQQIASTLNRLGLRTGAINTWSEKRVYSARQYHQLPDYHPEQASDGIITLDQAAKRLGVSTSAVRRMIQRKVINATQVVPCAPWQVPEDQLESESVTKAIRDIKNRVRSPRTHPPSHQSSLFS